LITAPDLVEQPPTTRAIGKTRRHTRYAVVGDHLIDFETGGFSLRPLMLDRLAGVGHAGVKECSHEAPSSVGMMSADIVVRW
jgi:hypothetical protein